MVQVKITWLHPGGGWVITEKNSTDRFSPLGRNRVVESDFGPAKWGWGGWKKHFVGINFPNNCVQLVEIKAIKNDEKISTIFYQAFRALSGPI